MDRQLGFILLVGAAVAGGASAQPAPAPPPASTAAPQAAPASAPQVAPQEPELGEIPPPPPSYEQPPPPPQAEPAAGEGAAAPVATCTPACAEGARCEQGRCVVVCSPACAAGEMCMPDGRCAPPSPLASEPLDEDVPPRPDPGNRAHDGFMFRGTLGFGASSLSETPRGGTLNAADTDERATTYSGASLGLSLDFGASVIDDLVLHARLGFNGLLAPSVTVDGVDQGSFDTAGVSAGFFGLGVTYYLMPLDGYVTGAIGWSGLSFSFDSLGGQRARHWSTQSGLGLQLDVGKEWWVSRSWGLGAALRGSYTGLRDLDTKAGRNADYTFLGLGVLFSATYQ